MQSFVTICVCTDDIYNYLASCRISLRRIWLQGWMGDSANHLLFSEWQQLTSIWRVHQKGYRWQRTPFTTENKCSDTDVKWQTPKWTWTRLPIHCVHKLRVGRGLGSEFTVLLSHRETHRLFFSQTPRRTKQERINSLISMAALWIISEPGR